MDTYPINLQDPVELNRYGYTANNPVNAVDPSGLTAVVSRSIRTKNTTIRTIGPASRTGFSTRCIFRLTVSFFIVMGPGLMPIPTPACVVVAVPHPPDSPTSNVYFAKGDKGGKQSKSSQKERATDAPSWVKGQERKPDETPQQAAKRMLDEKYGPGNWKKGPGSEFSKIVKYLQRSGKR